jgi:Zn-dependent protease
VKPLAFRVFGTPVEINVSIVLLFAYIWWQAFRLNRPFWSANSACLILLVAVILHELGHAAANRLFMKSESRVWIWALGGATLPVKNEELFRGWRRAAVAAAGPATNFLLAGVSLLLMFCARDEATLELAFQGLVINVLLAVSNLIPTMPFDGGHIFAVAVRWAFGFAPRFADFVVMVAGVCCGALLLLGAWLVQDPLLALGGITALFVTLAAPQQD